MILRDEEISQNNRLLLKGSTVIFQTIKSIITSQTVEGREHSDLTDNTICYFTDCCRRGA